MKFRRNAIHGNASPEEQTKETERTANGRLKENDKRTNDTIRYAARLSVAVYPGGTPQRGLKSLPLGESGRWTSFLLRHFTGPGRDPVLPVAAIPGQLLALRTALRPRPFPSGSQRLPEWWLTVC